jgi:hypothetical protein
MAPCKTGWQDVPREVNPRMPTDDYPGLSRRSGDGEGNSYEVFAYKGYEREGFFVRRRREFPIIAVVRETPSGEMSVLPHTEKARDEADARAIIDRIASQIEDGSFRPRGTDRDF